MQFATYIGCSFKTKRVRNSADSLLPIDAPEADYLYISASQLTAFGNGLYTAINIYKDEIIAVFKGEVLTQRQAVARAVKGNDKYFINLPDGTILDSMKVKCFAKYANDATGFAHSGFKNNAEISLDDNSEVCIVAIRNVKAGEELFCSYGKRYWKKHG